MDMRLFGVCGLYCGACTHYRSTQKDGKHLLNEYVRQGGEAEKFVCGGCQSGQLNPHLACSSCGIRDCVEERGITCCGHCDEYPCPYLITFQNDGRVHHLDILDNMKDIMEMGSEKWRDHLSPLRRSTGIVWIHPENTLKRWGIGKVEFPRFSGGLEKRPLLL
ncbi:MAG: DUF3795 domain-containing protein [Candidatus Atribacteria bacterium]|nr:DUF3795 domain-containing protein [Candidatus Atribacteria bacterium]